VRKLRDGLAGAQDNQCHVHEELEGLQGVDDMAEPSAVNPESNVAIALHRIAIRVELAKQLP